LKFPFTNGGICEHRHLSWAKPRWDNGFSLISIIPPIFHIRSSAAVSTIFKLITSERN
jgi:hypothetical protein